MRNHRRIKSLIDQLRHEGTIPEPRPSIWPDSYDKNSQPILSLAANTRGVFYNLDSYDLPVSVPLHELTKIGALEIICEYADSFERLEQELAEAKERVRYLETRLMQSKGRIPE